MRSRLEEAGEAGGGVGGSSSLPPGLGYLAQLYSSQGEVRGWEILFLATVNTAHFTFVIQCIQCNVVITNEH